MMKRLRYVLVPILRGNSPLMMQKMWVKGCLDDGEVRYVLMPILCGYLCRLWGMGARMEPL